MGAPLARRRGRPRARALATIANARFSAREVAPGTVLVQLPTFDDPRGVDSLFAAEGDRIRGAERLIVDVRGNGGGSDYDFRALAPLVYTGPVKLAGVSVLATDENVAAERAMAGDTTYPAAQREGSAAVPSRWRGRAAAGSCSTTRCAASGACSTGRARSR